MLLTDLEQAKQQETVKEKSRDYGASVHFAHVLTSEAVGVIGVESLQALAKEISPINLYPRLCDLKKGDVDQAVEILRSAETDLDFLSCLAEALSMASDEGLEALRNQGIPLEGDAIGEIIVTAYLKHCDAFRKARIRHLADDAAAGTSHLRHLTHVAPGVEPRMITKQLLTEAQQRFVEHFVKRKYGPIAILDLFESPRRIGFFVSHGGTRSGQVAIDAKEKRVFRFDRPERTDIMFFDKTTRLGWFRGQKRDLDFYAASLGFLLFGDERVFATPVKMNLSFAKAENLRALLDAVRVDDFYPPKLRHRTIDNVPRGRLVQPVGKHECVTDVYPALDALERAEGIVSIAKLWVERSDEHNSGGVIVVKPGSITFPATLPEEISFKILSELEVLGSYGN